MCCHSFSLGTIVDVAKEQANSLQNMKPTIWVNTTSPASFGPSGDGSNNSSGNGGGGGSLTSTFTELMRNAVPLNDAIRAQTGVDFLDTLNVKRNTSTSTSTTSASTGSTLISTGAETTVM